MSSINKGGDSNGVQKTEMGAGDADGAQGKGHQSSIPKIKLVTSIILAGLT